MIDPLGRHLFTVLVGTVVLSLSACHSVGPMRDLGELPPPPPSSSAWQPVTRAVSATSPAVELSRPVVLPRLDANPSDRVQWVEAPVLRAAPTGVSRLLADVESRLPPEMGYQYRDRDRATWCHETTHGVHAALRNRYRLPAFYPGGGRCALVESPPLTLGEVAAVVPERFRGPRYSTYLVNARRDWEREPLYVWDEWVAYNNGTTTAIEEGGRAGKALTDDAMACVEFSGYSLAVAIAAHRKGIPLTGPFRAFLAWELRRSFALSRQALTIPSLAWHDRRLQALWRNNDPFVAEGLRLLQPEQVSIAELVP